MASHRRLSNQVKQLKDIIKYKYNDDYEVKYAIQQIQRINEIIKISKKNRKKNIKQFKKSHGFKNSKI